MVKSTVVNCQVSSCMLHCKLVVKFFRFVDTGHGFRFRFFVFWRLAFEKNINFNFDFDFDVHGV